MKTKQHIGSIALTFKTKVLSATDITSQLKVTPDSFANLGESFRTTNGEIHKTGLQKWTLWTRIDEIEVGDDSHTIEGTAVEFAGICEEHTRFVASILHDGGAAAIQIRLLDNNNTGVEFSPLTLHRLSILGMSLSIEVFPEI